MESVTITLNQANRIAQMWHITTKDGARLTLTHLELMFSNDHLIVVGTNSHQLAVMYLETGNSIDKEVTVHVDAAELRDALVGMTKMVPKDKKKTATIMLLPYTRDTEEFLDITGGWEVNAPEFSLTSKLQGARWVQWRSLFNRQTIDPWLRQDDKFLNMTPEEVRLPAFAADYFVTMDKLRGSTVTAKKEMRTWQMQHTGIKEPGNAHLKPWCWVTTSRDTGITYMQMPVRP